MKGIVVTNGFIDRMFKYYSRDLGLPTKDTIITALLTAHWKFDGAYAFAHIPPKNGSFCLFVASDDEGKLVQIETFRSNVKVHEEINGYILSSDGQRYRLNSNLMACRMFD